MDTALLMKFFGALFAIMNPFTGLPVFLSMTEGADPAEQRSIALKVAFYVAVIGTVAALLGSQVLKLFGISIHDLQVAGGLVVLGLAFTMLHGSDSSMHHGTETEKAHFANLEEIAFYPLAFPLIMGPGTLTTLILFAGQTSGIANWIGYFVVFAVIVTAVAAIFSLGSRFGKHLSNTARVIMTRVMGLILAAIAIEMIFDGARALLPGLAGGS
jgi:multiple antibiotic resistance protein